MKSFDRMTLEKQTRLVSRYVAGDLSRSERAEFEAWLVASPELAAEVEMERRMRRGLASADRRGWLERGDPAVGNSATADDSRWRIALAASIVVSLGLAVSLVMSGPDEVAPATVAAPSRSQSSPRVASITVRLGSVRGLSSSPDLRLAKADAPAVLTLEPDVVVLTCGDGSLELVCPGGNSPQTPQYAEYEVDLVRRADASLSWRSPRVAPTNISQLAFSLSDPGSLETGDYDLLVRGRSADHEEVVARFWMRVTP
jgi:hypothetical protein